MTDPNWDYDAMIPLTEADIAADRVIDHETDPTGQAIEALDPMVRTVTMTSGETAEKMVESALAETIDLRPHLQIATGSRSK